MSTVLHSTLDPQEALRLILREAVDLTKASSGSVALINPTSGYLEIQVAQGLPSSALELKLSVGRGITGWVAKTGKPARIGRVHEDPRYVKIRSRARSELAVPLFVDQEPRGVLNVDSDKVNAFTSSDQELLEAFAAQAANVIQNTWVFEQNRLKARMFEGLISVSQAINSTLSLDDALQSIARECALLMDGKVCALHLLDEGREWLDLRACFGAGRAYLNKPRLNSQESLLGVVLRRQKPIQVENVQSSSRYQNRPVARAERLVSLLSVPLVFGVESIGTLSLYKGVPFVFSNEEIRVVQSLAQLSAIAIEKARLYERIVSVEEQLRQSERLSALGLLAAEVAHEIRNPLTVMKMLFHSLSLEFPTDNPKAKDVQIISEQMEHLNRIVEQVLGFARDAEPKYSLVDLNRLISDLNLITRHKLRCQNVMLHCSLVPNLPLVKADATQLEQVFLNLILNAVEAMPHGGRLTIATRISNQTKQQPTSRYAVVEFKDTGEGMSKAQCDGAFSSLLSSKKKGGTGLGLAIVHRVIDAHQGVIRIKSKVAKGTVVSILLPCSE